MKKKFLIANWKMNLNPRQSQAVAASYVKRIQSSSSVTTILCPSFTSLQGVIATVNRTSHVSVGSQDCFWKSSGSYTGEESPLVLSALGVRFVIVGHSERRIHLGESDAVVRLKVQSIMQDAKLVPILCIGENGTQKKSGKTFSILTNQLKTAFDGIQTIKQCLVAYEPIWAIGSGNPIVPADSKKISTWIREYLRGRFNSRIASVTPILYGGSVDVTNAHSIITEGGVDGLLVGSASLDAKQLAMLHDAIKSR